MTVYNPLAGIPKIGPWSSRVGKVIDILATPCDVQPMVWVYAFWTSAPVLLASLYKPDPVDYLTERGGRPHKHGRNRRFRPAWAQPPDLPVPEGKLGWAAFTLGKFIERAGWYMLVADATTQFAVNWTSLAYQWSGCRTPDAKYARSNVVTPIFTPGAAGTYIFNDWAVQSQNGFFADTNSISTPAGFQANVGINFNVKPHDFPPFPQAAVTAVRLKDGITGNTMWEEAPAKTPDGSYGAATLFKDYVPGEGTHDFYVEIDKTEGFFNAAGSTFSASGGSDRGLSPDP